MNGSKKPGLLESISMIVLVGVLVTVGIAIYEPLNDFSHGALRPVRFYLGWTGVSVFPLVALFVIFMIAGRLQRRH